MNSVKTVIAIWIEPESAQFAVICRSKRHHLQMDCPGLIMLASCSLYSEIIPDAEVGGGAGGTNVICSRPEVANDVISSYNVETFGTTCEFVSC